MIPCSTHNHIMAFGMSWHVKVIATYRYQIMAYAQANCIPETGLHLGRGVGGGGGGGKSMGENFMGGGGGCSKVCERTGG